VRHIERDVWHFTVLYWKTVRAHELGHTRDWVVLCCYDHDPNER
jgi:hypothetical protein